MSHQTLKGADFNNFYLNKINFSYADLSEATFKDSSLDDVILDSVSITNADFSKSIFKFVKAINIKTAINADFSGAIFYNSDLTGSDLSSSFAAGAKFNNSIVKSVNFMSADLEYADFTETTLDEKIEFKDAILSKTVFEKFEGVNRPVLSKKILLAKSISGISFSGAIFSDQDLRGSEISDADLSKCHLLNTDFENANLTSTKFVDARVNMSTNFKNAGLEAVNLNGVQEISELEDEDFANLLLATKTLFNVKGLSGNVRQIIELQNPSLFKDPRNSNNDEEE